MSSVSYVSAEAALGLVRSGDRVFVQGAAATPTRLIAALADRARAGELTDIKVVHLHTEGVLPYLDPAISQHFHVSALFCGANVRAAVADGRADYVPVFLSEAGRLFRQRILPLDVALIHVSPPDRHGYCSMGVSVDITNDAADSAKTVIAQVNPRMPRTYGDGFIHVSRIAAMVECADELFASEPGPLSDTELAIGQHVAALVDDGATLQMGIGAIPNAVLRALSGHKHLGIHTEMFSDGVVDLAEAGVITGIEKSIHHEKIISSFVMGSRRTYDFVDSNLSVELRDSSYVNDTAVIRRNRKMTAINSAIEIDLAGQVCADSIGTHQFSGVGGQMDFVRGASLAEGGRAILALPSQTSKGESRIVSLLKPGASVVTTRSHVHYIITEYGAVDLYGKTLRERARLLISIAHPDHRAELEAQAHQRYRSI
jgi:4-hydroxybutyrate CoA-transferase